MSLVINIPVLPLAGSPSEYCAFNALFNPYTLKIQRTDYNVAEVRPELNSSNQWTGRMVIFCTGSVHPEYPNDLGTMLYVNAGNGLYDGTYRIVGVQEFPPIFTVEGMPNLGTVTGGYVNMMMRTNWNIELRLKTGGAFWGLPLQTFIGKYRDNKRGLVLADVSALLKGLMPFKNDFEYDVENRRDLNLSRQFTFQYQEHYTVNGSQIDGRLDDYAWFLGVINGAKQLQHSHGNNYWENYPGELLNIAHRAKFFTKFKTPVYWNGWPFDLQFIRPGFVVTVDAPFQYRYRRYETEKDAANGSIQTTVATLDNSLTHMGAVNRLKIRGGYGENVKKLLVVLRIDELGIEDYGDESYADGYWHVNTGPDPGFEERNVTVIQEIEVRQCVTNPFYLCWLNSNGGWDYWMFSEVQFHENVVFDTDRYQPYVPFIDYSRNRATSREDFTGKKARTEVTMGANGITIEQMQGLIELMNSPKVYKMEQDGSRVVVKVKPGSFKTHDTKNNRADIEIEVELQDFYLQSNI